MKRNYVFLLIGLLLCANIYGIIINEKKNQMNLEREPENHSEEFYTNSLEKLIGMPLSSAISYDSSLSFLDSKTRTITRAINANTKKMRSSHAVLCSVPITVS